MAITDDFATLGLTIGAPPEDVVERYRRKAMTLHPDVVGTGDAAKFSALNRAYHAALTYARDEPCPICRGTRKMTHTRGINSVEMACTACGQTGRKHRGK